MVKCLVVLRVTGSTSLFTPSLPLSYVSLSPSCCLPPHFHFCNLLQLIESQWCENMALWQRERQGARSSLSLYNHRNICEERLKQSRAEISARAVLKLFYFIISLTLLLLLLLLLCISVCQEICSYEMWLHKIQTRNYTDKYEHFS